MRELQYWLFYLNTLPKAERSVCFKQLLVAAGKIVAVAVVLFALFPWFAKRTLFGNQSTAYNSWTRLSGVFAKVGEICSTVGYGWFILSALALLGLVVQTRRKAITRQQLVGVLQICASALVTITVALVLFWRVQDLSIQHWYIFIMMLDTLIAVPLVAFAASPFAASPSSTADAVQPLGSVKATAPAPSPLPAAAAVVFSLLCLLNGFSLIPADLGNNTVVSTIFGTRCQWIYNQTDLATKDELYSYLVAHMGEVDTVYVAAASSNFNHTLLQTIAMFKSDTAYKAPITALAADVDSRDGFNTGFFDAKYVVCSDPVQLHMVEENEQVVANLNAWVQDQSSTVGAHYKLVGTYALDGNVTAKIYERTSDFTETEVKEVQAFFDGLYPDLPELFHDRFDAYLKTLAEP